MECKIHALKKGKGTLNYLSFLKDPRKVSFLNHRFKLKMKCLREIQLILSSQ